MTQQLLDEIELVDLGTSGTTALSVPSDHPKISWCENTDGGVYDSTACGRMYTACWKLDRGTLSLVRLRGHRRLASSIPVPADWVTGVCFIDFGKYIDTIAEDVLSERCLAVQFEAGRVTRSSLWCDDGADTVTSYRSRERFRRAFKGETSPRIDEGRDPFDLDALPTGPYAFGLLRRSGDT